MSAQSYRRLLGIVLLWALAPLPLLYIILPPFWVMAMCVGALLTLWPAIRIRLPTWALNLIGIGIIVAVFAAGGLRVGPLRPLGHLLLLLTSVRAIVVSDRRTFFGALLPTFLVWVVALTSSTHVVVVIYFTLSAVLWWFVGMRTHLAGIEGAPALDRVMLPRPRHVVSAAMVALLLSVPIFLALPRLRSPWVAGRGGASSVTGFSSHVDLAGVGAIRESHEAAILVRMISDGELDDRWMRLRAASLERVTNNSWAPRGAILSPVRRGGLVWPLGVEYRLDGAAELELELLRPRRYLFLPEGTIALAAPVPVLTDPSGGVVLSQRVRGPMVYRVWVARDQFPTRKDPARTGPPRFELHPEVRRITEEVVAGLRTDREKAAAIESYLQLNFGYSLNGMNHIRADPVAWFLLEERTGHCEYFAGAMVAMLDGIGIPARMVTGYSGGDLSSSGDGATVREANAHAWVEARVGAGKSWIQYDPTPEGAVPALVRPRGRERVRMAWDWVQSSWDRYVLTFGLGEQIQLLTAAADGMAFMVRHLEWRRLLWLAALVVLSAAFFWIVRRKIGRGLRARYVGPPAARAVARVARKLQRRGVEVPGRATIRWIARRARSQWPAAGPAVAELAWQAERELYSDDNGSGLPRQAVRELWATVAKAMKQ